MNDFFKRLPLPLKLLLTGLFPLVFLIYFAFQIYFEKNEKLSLLGSYIDRIYQSANINTLIDHLQKERKLSFEYSIRKQGYSELLKQRPQTDSLIHLLDKGILKNFASYSFLIDLQKVRGYIDSGYLPPGNVTHYYTTAIFRINTLNAVFPGGEIYLKSIYKDLEGQKLLSDMITNLGILRSNIYNSLYTKKNMPEMLMGTMGVYDVYKTYVTEFLVKAPADAVESFNEISAESALKPTISYLDTLFKRFKQDSSYTAEEWWKISNQGVEELVNLRKSIGERSNNSMNALLAREKKSRNNAIIFLMIVVILAVAIVLYSIISITRSLTRMKTAAKKISEGYLDQPLKPESRDVIGSLAISISRIDSNNQLLAKAADAIGNGNFETAVPVRGNKDVLGNAIVSMKARLQQKVSTIKENNEELRLLASHLHEIREEERASMAREVHDELGQHMTIIKMDISRVYKKLDDKETELKQKLAEVLKQLDNTVVTIRKISAELRPGVLDDFGLIEAMRWQSQEFEKRSNIKVNFDSNVDSIVDTGEKIPISIFRIYQESLTNIARHSGADLVDVEVKVEDGKFSLVIRDNGNGFDHKMQGKKKTLGLLGMKERTLMINGQFEISSVPGKGTTVTVNVPLCKH